MRRLLALLLLAALSFRAMPGAAQDAGTGAPPAAMNTPPAPPIESASLPALLRRGATAAANGRYEVCVEAYAAALAIEDTDTTAGELGVCEEALGRNLAAYDHLRRALDGEVRAAPPPIRALWKRYNEAYTRVTSRIARVFVLVSPNEAEVLLDGKSLGKHVSGRVFPVLPGKHTWTARLDNGEEHSTVRTYRGGDIPDVTMTPGTPMPPPPRRCDACKDRQPSRVYFLEPEPEPPCMAARGVPMSPALCSVFEDVYRRRVTPLISVALGGLVSAGFTADPGFGIHAGAGLHWNDKDDLGFVLLGEVRGLFPALAGFDSAGYSKTVSLVSFGVAPCLRYQWALGCLIVDAGFVFKGDHPDSPFRDSPIQSALFNVGIGPRLGVDLPIAGRFGLRAFADLRLSPEGYSTYRDLGLDNKSVHTQWSNSIASGLFGLGVTFK